MQEVSREIIGAAAVWTIIEGFISTEIPIQTNQMPYMLSKKYKYVACDDLLTIGSLFIFKL